LLRLAVLGKEGRGGERRKGRKKWKEKMEGKNGRKKWKEKMEGKKGRQKREGEEEKEGNLSVLVLGCKPF
jgi:hypothetical protein